ncbi:MAG TPA: sugar phosphate nucleotidyltransferase [Candidatus Omnitrophota bacterium]|nr:sugar phosphate nucleotidyltransferase [Candidatus Omnitrophota bacterium]HPN55897.1 sugar phosphate nucleotidyltransferase [Candidatus Omnitrophota bacterium]
MAHTGTTDVVVLAGGLGTRLRSEIGLTQKTMAAIGDRPFLFFMLKRLAWQGFRRIILCTGFQAQAVEEYFKREPLGLDIVFSREDTPLGTGGAFKKAASLVQGDLFLLLNGDSLCDMDYAALLDFHARKQALVTLTLSEVPPRMDTGSVIMNSSGAIVDFREKSNREARVPSGHHVYVNAGVYCFNRRIFSFFPPGDVFSLENDFFPSLLTERVYGFVIKKGFLDIGTPQRYAEARRDLKLTGLGEE